MYLQEVVAGLAGELHDGQKGVLVPQNICQEPRAAVLRAFSRSEERSPPSIQRTIGCKVP